jgi:hypothetical protein
MSESTFHVTGEDVRKMESKESKFHDGKTPKDSDASALKVYFAPHTSLPSLLLWPLHITEYN